MRLTSLAQPSPRSKVTKSQNIMLLLIIAFSAGFLAGFLVFRNNAAKAEKVVQVAKDIAKK